MRLSIALLHLLHLAVIGFTLVGWIWPETRLAHLALCALIHFSWWGLGLCLRRPGYCFLTGIQNRLWESMGEEPTPSYVHYLVRRVTGRDADPRKVSLLTQAIFYSCTILSIALL